MTHGDLAQLAAVLGGVGTAVVVLLRHRLALLGGFALLAAAEALLATSLVPRHNLERLQGPLGAAAVVVAAGAVAAAALLLVRRPQLAVPALLLAAPFRVPVQLGDQRAFLLVPFYGVLAAVSLAFLYRWLRGAPVRSIPRVIALPAVAFVAFSALSLLWSLDLRQGSIELVFFLFPFAAAFALVARASLAPWLRRSLGTLTVALASLFALIGLWQAATHRVFFAQDLRVANAYTTFFRVTSVFKDPSLYGRYLVFGFAVLAVALWLGRVSALLAAAASALLFAGLYLSYSQSSMVTLAAVLVAVTLAAGDRTARLVIAGTAAVALAVGAAFIVSYALDHPSRRVTSGRSRLVSVTARVIRDHPLTGVGVGAQPKASNEESARRGLDSRDASHTTPLTVAAELGVAGVVLYLAFLAGALRILWLAYLRERALGLGLAAVFLAVFTHSLVYSGFFEDPFTLGVLAVAAATVAVQTTPAAVGVVATATDGQRATAESSPAGAPAGSAGSPRTLAH